MTSLLQFTKKIFENSHRQPQCTSQLVCEDRVLFVSVNLHFSLCGQQHQKRERAILLMCPSPTFFSNLRSSCNTTKKKIQLS